MQAATRPGDGLALLARGGFDAVILDVMLPEFDGFEVCRRIRQLAGSISAIPVLMLTARGELSDRVVGLELGADDYLPKPFEPRELAARLQTILRRARPVASVGVVPGVPGVPGVSGVVPGAAPGASTSVGFDSRWLVFDGLQIDTERRAVLRGGEAVELTSTEFELLMLLAREPQRVFTRDEILNRLRGRDADLYTRAVDLLVSRLRRKLAPLDAIKALRNVG